MPEHRQEVVLGAVGRFGLAPRLAQCVLDFLAAQELRLQRQRALLQERDLALAQAHVAAQIARGSDVVVRVADLAEAVRLRLVQEAPHRVGAEQRERVLLAQAVPESFQEQRRLLLPAAPEQIHHLAVRPNLSARSHGDAPRDRRADECLEARPVRLTSGDESGDRLGSVEGHELIRALGLGEIKAHCAQHPLEHRGVLRGGDHQQGLALGEAFSEEGGDGGGEHLIVVVEPEEMARGQQRRCRGRSELGMALEDLRHGFSWRSVRLRKAT